VPDLRLYPPFERPLVEVEVDGVWWRGFLHAWFREEPGGPWFANARARVGGQNRELHVPADRIRLIDED
jgi:hypothetical protein